VCAFWRGGSSCWLVVGSIRLRPFPLVRRPLQPEEPGVSAEDHQGSRLVGEAAALGCVMAARVVAPNWTLTLVGERSAPFFPSAREARYCCVPEPWSSAYRTAGSTYSTKRGERLESGRPLHSSRDRQAFGVAVNPLSAVFEMHSSCNSAFFRTPRTVFTHKRLPSLVENSGARSGFGEWKRKCI
jgi:hypothetical protein